jgi:hypothetical protein
MSGYGYYDEEGEGLLTGAGARAKKRFVQQELFQKEPVDSILKE